MTRLDEALRGRRITGVVPLAPRAFALAFARGETPRSYLWVHVDRKEASLALAPDLPVAADPRGSRFGGLEIPVRGLAIRDAAIGPDGLRLVLAPEPDGAATAELTVGAGAKRANVVLRSVPESTVLWALHRDETEAAEEAGPQAPPPGFQPPRIRVVEGTAGREALRERIGRDFREDFLREATKSLDRAEHSLARRVEALEGDRSRSSERILDRRKAEILLAHLHEIRRGASRVGLPDPYADSPGSRIEIALDPSLSPHENAARLFRAAKRGERGAERIEARLRAAREGLARIADLRRVLLDRPAKEALDAIEAFHREAGVSGYRLRGDQREIHLGRRTAMAPRAGRPGRPSGAHHPIGPRTFTTSDGWEVWVGRNNTQNDQITHRLSNPHDYWLHVVGVPGSHVILRRPSRNATPKPRTLEEAASIAAYFSKARKLTRVPVIYTERKFVTRPRRGKPGQALCSRERELLVRPRLPEGDAGTESE
ncbi:MAG TPA: NFACT RNA binding domain-containing protein [Candidatus Binatia bacterium]|nr:NFACT RNA binding domain-containing protein [Candidatus Binatia bacterium]